jgi:hypothetical protein
MIHRLSPLTCLAAVSFATAVALAPLTPASAAWSAPGSGSGAGAAAVMPTGAAPHLTLSGTNVTVTWTAATLSSGAAVAGYKISRFAASNGAPATVGAGCSGVVTTTSCTEVGVAAGQWVYTDTPVEVNWTGGQSADSSSVAVP